MKRKHRIILDVISAETISAFSEIMKNSLKNILTQVLIDSIFLKSRLLTTKMINRTLITMLILEFLLIFYFSNNFLLKWSISFSYYQ